MTERFTEDKNGRVVYYISERSDHAKDTIFFLHGLTADHTMFDMQVEYFESNYNIITWDAPCHGASKAYPELTYEIAAKFIKQILDENGLSKVILIGQSMGGFISQAFICRYPGYAQAFIGIDTTPYGDYYSPTDKWWLRQVEWMSKLYPEKLLRSALAKQTANSPVGQKNMSRMISAYDKAELCHLMGVGFRAFLDDNRPLDIPCPVLLIVGEKDRTGKVIAYNKAWSAKTGYPIKWIPDAAHNSNVDAPEAVNKYIAGFLKTI